MRSIAKKTVTKPLTERQPMCDNDILRLLADQHGRAVSEMVACFHVTQTAIRNRLRRLALAQSVTRKRGGEGRRGRPRYLYYITSRGRDRLGGGGR
jgi:predicted ArsR family transcriptional regulator